MPKKLQELDQRNSDVDFPDRAFRWDLTALRRGLAADVSRIVDSYPACGKYLAADSAPNATTNSSMTCRAFRPAFFVRVGSRAWPQHAAHGLRSLHRGEPADAGVVTAMITLNHILVPHDFGDTSKTAMDYAIALARMFNAVLDVLHVRDRADTIIPARFPRELYDELETTVRERLLRITALDETKPSLDFHLRSGTVHAEILRFAREQQTDLIVMGTHGRGAVARAVMGSVAETVVRTAPCPVLTVRKPPREYLAPNILVPTDFGVASDTALSYGRTLVHTFGGRLHLLHVMENYFMRPIVADPRALEAAARRQLGERLTTSDRDNGATAILEVSDHPATAIVEYANASHIDFIVMGTHGRQSMERLLTDSVAEHVVRTASCPVLTVRHPEREFIVDDEAAAEPSRA